MTKSEQSGKYDIAIEALAIKARDIGGDLYTIELAKEDKISSVMLEMFSGLGSQATREDFKNILSAIKVLKKAEKELRS